MAGSTWASGDPLEGSTPDGLIVTGASRTRVPAPFEPVLADAVAAIGAVAPDATVYVYGSVATGQARVGPSDVDLLTLDLPVETAAALTTELSARFAALARSVDIAPAQRAEVAAATDEGYGLRVFLHHYCVPLAGRPYPDASVGYPADRAAARGFDGDIARHAAAWTTSMDEGEDPAELGRRLARKTLFAVAALVSVHDQTWTTNRRLAAARWAQVDPTRADGLAVLSSWMDGAVRPTGQEVAAVLDDTVAVIVARFAADIGLWS